MVSEYISRREDFKISLDKGCSRLDFVGNDELGFFVALCS